MAQAIYFTIKNGNDKLDDYFLPLLQEKKKGK